MRFKQCGAMAHGLQHHEREHRERGKAKEGESGNPAYICIDSQWLAGVQSVPSATMCLRYITMGVDTVTVVPVCM